MALKADPVRINAKRIMPHSERVGIAAGGVAE
jgi:hypothetical protein